MRAINLVDALQREKFKPFELYPGSRKTVPVKLPDRVLLRENKTDAFVAEGERLRIVGLDHISNPLA
jgi:hypothetical protein